MKEIKEYPLRSEGTTTIKVQKGARILSLEVSNYSGPTLYMLVDPDNETEQRIFTAIHTNFSVNHNAEKQFVGTAVVHTGTIGEYVCHFFELRDGDNDGG